MTDKNDLRCVVFTNCMLRDVNPTLNRNARKRATIAQRSGFVLQTKELWFVVEMDLL